MKADSHQVKIRCGDMDHEYFQGEKLTEKMLLDPPKDGALSEKLAPGAKLLALVPIYGTKNAGRGLWNKYRNFT